MQLVQWKRVRLRGYGAAPWWWVLLWVFLQLDNDPSVVYNVWRSNAAISNVQDTWCYLYAKRDWTYFMKPFFNVSRNNEIYTYMMDTYPEGHRPASSDHINGILFEPSILGRNVDTTFGDMVRTCKFLAEHHHGRKFLVTLSQRYTNMFSYEKLRELTADGDDFNAVYGSQCSELDPDTFRFPASEWIDDYDKTGSYVAKDDDWFKYKYNLGQSHAIDDFDEDSVWFYITMVEPLEEQEDVSRPFQGLWRKCQHSPTKMVERNPFHLTLLALIHQWNQILSSLELTRRLVLNRLPPRTA